MLTIGGRAISVNDFQKIIFGSEKITIASQAKERVRKSHSFLESFYKDKIIYGINTGLGPMAQ